MDAVEFIKEYYRICEAHEDCVDCPFTKEEIDIPCDLISKNAEKIVSIVKQWAEEHPRKTMIQDFFEKFPNAPRTVNGLPFLVHLNVVTLKTVIAHLEETTHQMIVLNAGSAFWRNHD